MSGACYPPHLLASLRAIRDSGRPLMSHRGAWVLSDGSRSWTAATIQPLIDGALIARVVPGAPTWLPTEAGRAAIGDGRVV